MKKILTYAFILIGLKSTAQFNFQHLYGGINQERCQSQLETYNNLFLVNGASTSFGQGNVDVVFIKNDNHGRAIWSKTYGLSDYDNSEFAIECPDYGYLGIGRSIVNVGSGTTDAWVFKTDSAGNLLWSKAYGNAGENDAFLQGLNTIDNGFTFLGNARSVGAGSDDVFLVHTDANGDTLFTRTYGTPELEGGLGIIQTHDGGYAICGRQVIFTAGIPESDGFIIRTDANGDMLWSELYGDSLWEEFQSIQELADGRLAITGSTVSFGQGNYDILLMITDSLGNPINAYAYGGANSDAAYTLNLNADETFTISGYTESYGYGHVARGSDSTNIFLLKTDTLGSLIWMVSYGDGLQDEAFRSAKTSDGGFLISGFTNDYVFPDSSQMLAIKTDSMGFSGCHEGLVTPLIATAAMPHSSIAFIQGSGVDVNSVNVVETIANVIDDDACLYAGVSQIVNQENKVICFPIPFCSELNFDFASIKAKEARVKIMDINGAVVIDQLLEAGQSLNTESLTEGIYFSVFTATDITIANKIIKVIH